MPLIGIDCRFAGLSVGIGRYTREIVTALLSRNDGISYVLFVRDSHERWISDLPGSARIIPFNAPHYSLREQRLFPRLITQTKIDLLFSPQFNVPYFCPVAFVVTIHDLILHRFPSDVSPLKRFAYRVLMKRAISKARSIVTISNATKTDLLNTYAIDDAKITIAYPGISKTFIRRNDVEQHAVTQKYQITKPFFLYIGANKPHKNVSFLIDAFTKANVPNHQLILIINGKEADRIAHAGNVRVIQNISDDDAAALYSAATAFVSASLCEGFGLPFVEAMACGCPVIGMDRTSIPEVTGSRAILLDRAVDQWSAALNTVAQHPPSPDDRMQLIEHASRFDWNKTAEEIAGVLRNTIA